MRICTIGWLFGLLSMATGLCTYAGYCLIFQELSFHDAWDVTTCQRALLLYGAFLLRFSTLAIVLERGIATYMLNYYEGKKSGTIVYCLILYLMVLPVVQLVAYYVFGLTGTKLTSMVFALDIFAFTICLFVRRWNRKLLKKRLNSSLTLSERYQINENVRFLQLLFPSALSNYIYCTFLVGMHVTNLFIVQIPTDRRMVITHFGYSILVAASLFLPVFREGPLSEYRKIRHLWCCHNEISHNVNPKRTVVEKPNWETYFENYKKAWEPLRYATFADYCLLGFAILCSFCAGICFPVVCVVMQKVHAGIIEAQAYYDAGKQSEIIDSLVETVIGQCIYIAITGVVMFVFGYFSMLSFYVLCERQVDKMRKEFFHKVLNQDMEWFDSTDPGAVIQNMASSFERIRDGMSDKIGFMILACSSLTIGTAYALYIHWKLALVLLGVTPLIVLSMFFSIKTIIAAGTNQNKQYSAAGAIAHEVISSIKTVYKKCLDIAKKVGIKKAAMTGFFSGLYVLVFYTSVGLGFWYGTQLALTGGIQPGVVLAVFWAVIFGALQIGQALPSLGAVINAKIATKQILDIIDKKPKMLSRKMEKRLPSITGQIYFKNVNFSYPTRPTVTVLRGVSFKIQPGEKVAVVGYSGSGKSTILSLLMKLYRPDQGQIRLDNTNIDDLDTNWIRSSIGYVSQDPVIFSATVEQNLKMGYEMASEEEIVQACKIANAHSFIEKLPNGYRTIIGEGGVGLSGGQKQRISIAREIIKNPKLLLLDEATSALDSESEALVQEALNNCSSGRTMIIIAHRLSTVRNVDRILVFHAGQIVESGTHEELMKLNGNYYQLVLAQKLNQDEDIQEEEVQDVNEDSDIMRANLRLRKSLSNVRRTESRAELEDKTEELEKENAEKAKISDIFRYCKPESKLIISGVIMSFVKGLQWPLFAILVGQVMLILSSQDTDQAMYMNTRIFLAFAILGVISGVATFTAGILLGASGEKMAARMRLAVFRNILRQDGYYFDESKHSIEKLTTRLSTDAYNVQAAVDQRLSDVLQGVTSLILGLGYAFYISPAVAPICFLSNIILALSQIAIVTYLKKRGESDAKSAEPAAQIAGESISNIKTVQLLVQQPSLFKAFCEASSKPYKKAISRGFLQSLYFAISIAFTCYNFALTYYTGILLIKAGFTTPYTLFQVIESLHMGALLILAAANYLPEYLKARLSAGLMFTMMNEIPKVDSLSEGGIRHEIEGDIKLNRIKFCYPNGGRHFALDGFNLTASKGQTVAIVGTSGSGKSTAVQLIERFYEPYSGTIFIDNIDISNLNLRHLRSQVALVGQDPSLFNLSIKENIAYALPGATQEEIEEAAKFANIHNFIISLPEQYETKIGSKGTQLSGGQKQRIAIARAVIRRPKILLLDEATSALDSENEQLVQEALDRFRVGRTCITIAHRLSTVQSADWIIVMRDGKQVESGSHQSLCLDDGLYASLVKKQNLS